MLCAVLTVLQFRWTGELARAEFDRLGGDQHEAAGMMASGFDRTLSEAVAAITPRSGSITPGAATAKVKAWAATGPRPVFARIGLAIAADTGLELHLLDPATGKATHAATWPAEWTPLLENLEEKAAGFGGGPFRSRDGFLFEMPLFSRNRPAGERRSPGPPSGTPPGDGVPPREAGWMIFELDSSYVKSDWLPDLVKNHVNPGTRDVHHVEVAQNGEIIFSSGPSERLGKPLTVRFNRRGRGNTSGGMGGPGDPGWTLTTRRQTGALEEIVASSRRRNLVLACGVNLLILAAGYALIRQTRKSRRFAEAKMDFVANVSHELRTPVTVIMGAAHNLKRGIVKKPEAQERYADLILHHGQQLSDMVQEVLEFSSAGRALAPHEMKPVALCPLVAETLEELTAELDGMKVEVEVPEDLPPVAGDAPALTRVLRNLIGNAAKHARDGGWIRVEATASNGRVELCVEDRGPGIPQGEQGRVFEPFFRGADAHEKQTRGTGLGLGLVREIIQAHGGKATVASARGKGTKFTINLPVTAPH